MTAIELRNEQKRNHLAWLVLIPVLLVALIIGVAGSRGPRTNTDRVNAIASEFKCPTCRSESVETSNAQTARIIRADIARRVEAGESDDEIRAFLISRYGQDLLLTPRLDRREQPRVDPPGRRPRVRGRRIDRARSGVGMRRARVRSATPTDGSSRRR